MATIDAGDALSSPDIVIGDKFLLQITFDETITDTQSETSRGTFQSALTNITLTRSEGTGSWNPTGTFNLPHDIELFNAPPNANDRFSIAGVTAANMPSAAGRAFEFLTFSLSDDGSGTILNDTGAGQTLESQFVFGIDFTQFSSSIFNLNFTGMTIQGNLAVVPESDGYFYTALASALLVAGIRRLRQQGKNKTAILNRMSSDSAPC